MAIQPTELMVDAPRKLGSRITIAALAFFLAFHSVAQEQLPQQTDKDQLGPDIIKEKTAEKLRELGLIIGWGKNVIGYRGGHFVLFEKQESGWKLIDISNKRHNVTNFIKEEELFISEDLSYVQPMYQEYSLETSRKENAYTCFIGSIKSRKLYNPCDSSLTYTSETHVGSTALIGVMTFGISLAMGLPASVVVDDSKVLDLIQKSEVLDTLRARKAAAERNEFITRYHDDFHSARTSSDYNLFIRTYRNEDPDNLIPQATTLRDELIIKEEDEKKQLIMAEIARKEELVKKEEQERQYEEEQKRQRMAQIEKFRRGIKVETETNCGPVLEVRGVLVKIYFPVANYGNEHWVKKEQLLPSGYGCRFLNGNYQFPPI